MATPVSQKRTGMGVAGPVVEGDSERWGSIKRESKYLGHRYHKDSSCTKRAHNVRKIL